MRQAAADLKAAGVVSIGVCYLFSFMNPAHEERTAALIREVFPQANISLSCEVLSRVREWPRLSATLLNAYLAPVLVSYIADLEKRLSSAGVTTQQRFLMQSNGGVMPFAAAVTGHKTDTAQPVVRILRPGAATQRLSAARGRARTGHTRHGAARVATSLSSKAARRSKSPKAQWRGVSSTCRRSI